MLYKKSIQKNQPYHKNPLTPDRELQMLQKYILKFSQQIINILIQLQLMKEQNPRAGNDASQSKDEQKQQQQQMGTGSAVRMVYNTTPATKDIAMSIGIPNAIHYTPFRADIDPQNFVYSDSLICKKCGTYLNLHCQMYQGKKIWVCCICRQQNFLTPGLSQQLIDSQTYDVTSYTTQQTPIRKQKIYLFVVDLCVSEKQMKAIQKSLLQFIESKAQQSYENIKVINRIGLITYSKYVYCYELSSKFNTVVCIHPQRLYDSENVQKLLNVKLQQTNKTLDKYFLNAKTGKEKLQKRIKKLKAQGNVINDNDPTLRQRAKRAFGQALNIAISLSQFLPSQCRIVNLVGGPCTHGIGRTINTDFKQQMRSIHQYQNGQNLTFYQMSSLFYNSLKQKMRGKRSAIDLFIFSIQQTGLSEIYDLFRQYGGLLVLGEQFDGQHKIFEKSFRKAFIESQDNQMSCSLTNGCVITVTCSKDILINGALGCCKSLQTVNGKKYASQKPIGFGQTNSWFASSMNCYKTITFIYELSSLKAEQPAYYIQLRVMYQDYWGFNKTRITTVKREWDTNTVNIIDNFDQEAAIVALARWYSHRAQFQPKVNFRQWVDKLLVKFTIFFSNYIKGDHQSFTLPQKAKFFPQFVYHLRRNPIFRRIGLSLDQLTYHSHLLNTETVEHCLIIIQPALLSYTIEKPYPSPVRLEEEEMKNSVILLLDTYFNILLWYGENIEYWQNEQYHKQKQYQHVKILLQAPVQDIKYLISNRFPSPGFYKTNTGHSKQRILKSKVSPAASELHSENTLTDDKSVHTFMKALVQIVVNGKAL